MFIMPHPLHFAECMAYHYKCRMAQATEPKEFNFCSEQYNHYTNLINVCQS